MATTTTDAPRDGASRPTPPPPVTLTDAAAARVHALMARATTPVLGIRVGVKKAGCSGLQYQIEYVEEAKPFEDVVESKGVRVYIDPMAVMYLLGSEMDYEETKMHSGFVFRNPNEKDRCGCGESFTV
ncbi:HesB/IscA family protein [Roseospira goensis]|uniref:Iron-sulfur cluster assembly protein n=1 Tax=Roseospira goensis TaxID=391922 RepID=A0A7W6S111_9PROT|nr:iron-sulfur cluster assembly accessory protein [Roseospira goensis]MBB4286736.1 iron-sulfur cluster assembly protein [Roseospira goensis]